MVGRMENMPDEDLASLCERFGVNVGAHPNKRAAAIKVLGNAIQMGKEDRLVYLVLNGFKQAKTIPVTNVDTAKPGADKTAWRLVLDIPKTEKGDPDFDALKQLAADYIEAMRSSYWESVPPVKFTMTVEVVVKKDEVSFWRVAGKTPEVVIKGEIEKAFKKPGVESVTIKDFKEVK